MVMARGGNTYLKFVRCPNCKKKGVYVYLNAFYKMLGFRCKYCSKEFTKADFTKDELFYMYS